MSATAWWARGRAVRGGSLGSPPPPTSSSRPAWPRCLEDVPAGFEHLLRLVSGYITALRGAGVASRAFLLLWATAPTSPEFGPIFAERDEGFRADLRADVERAVAEGTVRADVDPHAVAVAVLGQLRGISMQHQLTPDAVDTEGLAALVADSWRRALRAD